MDVSHHPSTTVPVLRDLVLLGGGHSHLSVITAFGTHPEPGVRVTLVTRDVLTPYSGMLPGLVAGHYGVDDCHIDLHPLCARGGIRLLHASACGIDAAARCILVAGQAPLHYDWLSINTGSRPALDTIPGALEHGVAVKPIDVFLQRWQAVLDDLATAPRPFRVLVVGGGAAAVEMALACRERVRAHPAPLAGVSLGLVCAGDRLLETHNRCVQRWFARHLAAAGIAVHTGRRVCRAGPAGVDLDDGGTLAADLVIWAIQAGAPAWTRATGLDCDERGFIRVDDCLRTSDARVFAGGDIASLPRPVAKSGVYAVREGPVLAANLRRALRGEPLQAYRPQRRFLSLLSTGGRHAVVSRGPLFAAGAWAWWWKDRIDRGFMRRFRAGPVTRA